MAIGKVNREGSGATNDGRTIQTLTNMNTAPVTDPTDSFPSWTDSGPRSSSGARCTRARPGGSRSEAGLRSSALRDARGGRCPALVATLFIAAVAARPTPASGQGASRRLALAPGPVGPVRTLAGPPTVYRVACFAPGGGAVAAGGAGGLVRVWDVAGNRPPHQVRARAVVVDAIALGVDARRVAASGPAEAVEPGDPFGPALKTYRGSVLDVWDIPAGRRLATIEPTGAPYGLAFGPDGSTVAAVVSGEEPGLALWKAEGGVSLTTIGGRGDPRRSMWHGDLAARASFGRDLRRVAALGLLPRTARVWDLDAGRVADLAWEDVWPSGVSCALGPDGRSLAVIDIEGVLAIWSTESRSLVRSGRRPDPPADAGPFPVPPDPGRRPLALAYDPAGGRVVAGLADGSLRVFDAATAEVAAEVRGPAGPVRALAFVGTRVRVVAGGGTIPRGGAIQPSPLLVWEAGPPPTP